jgi:hypothetical protein
LADRSDRESPRPLREGKCSAYSDRMSAGKSELLVAIWVLHARPGWSRRLAGKITEAPHRA